MAHWYNSSVPAFLSPGWFDALPPAPATAETPEAVIHQTVTGAPQGDVEFWVAVENGRAHFAAGPPAAVADVHISEDFDTAMAVHRGEIPVETALSSGRIRIAGDTARLAAAAPALAAAANGPGPGPVTGDE